MLNKIPRPTIFAHRGASAYAPENTLAAFKLAVRQQADAIEFDVKLSLDAEVVVIHDQTVDRTTHAPGRVCDLTLDEIRKLAQEAGVDFEYTKSAYPHYFFIDDVSSTGVFDLSGRRVRQFLDYAVSADLSALKPGNSISTTIATPKGVMTGKLSNAGNDCYQLAVPVADAGVLATWLRDLSDGFVSRIGTGLF